MQHRIKKGQVIQLQIDNMSHQGQGIGRIDDFVVFVEGALAGEKVIVKMDKVKKRYSKAHVIKIIEPSPDRITPQCPKALKCGGCNLQHMSYESQLAYKTQQVKDILKRMGHIDTNVFDTLGMKNPWNYRNKVQYVVGKIDGEPIAGFYEKGTHNIISLKECMIDNNISDKATKIILDWMKKYNISIYDRKRHKGLLRHIVTRKSFATRETMIILVINGHKIPKKQQLIDMLLQKEPNIKSIVINKNTKKTNVVLGRENTTIYGRDYITEKIGDIKFLISPSSFFQVNPIQTKVLYKKALEYAGLTGQEIVIDAYCGIGSITLFLAKKAKKVYGIEIVEEAIEDAKQNAKINNIKNTEFYQGKAEEIMPKLYRKGLKPNVIVVDPPRKGCDEKLLNTMVKMNPVRIVYVSCNPATLTRDLRFLEDEGYKTCKVQPVDMFPQTSHIECVAEIHRK